MKINISASSSWNWNNDVIVEAETIDEAINKIRNKEIDISKIIGNNSDLYYKEELTAPNTFVIKYYNDKDYDVEIEIYDDYRE